MSSPTSWEKYPAVYNYYMFHYVHQLAANFVCVSFSAGKVLTVTLSENSCLLLLENSKVA